MTSRHARRGTPATSSSTWDRQSATGLYREVVGLWWGRPRVNRFLAASANSGALRLDSAATNKHFTAYNTSSATAGVALYVFCPGISSINLIFCARDQWGNVVEWVFSPGTVGEKCWWPFCVKDRFLINCFWRRSVVDYDFSTKLR